MRTTFIDVLTSAAKKDKNIVLLTGDLGYGAVEVFKKACPEQYVNCGIAELNMLGVAAGLASEGKKVFIYSIGNFVTERVLEQIRNSICYMNLDVNILAVGAGFEYGQLGFSHHATEDIACMRAMPNMRIYNPATAVECEGCVNEMIKCAGPKYIRLNKKGVGVFGNKSKAVPTLIKNGKDIAIFATGVIIEQAIIASEIIKSQGVDIAIYSFPKIKDMDAKIVVNEAKKYKKVITLEEHTIIGGFGSMMAEIFAEQPNKPLLKRLGAKDEFIKIVGDRKTLYKLHGIDAESIAKEILEK